MEDAIGGARYFLGMVNKSTTYMNKYILRYKSDALEKFPEWKTLSQWELGNAVKQFPTDGGGVYTFKKFAEYHKP